MKKLFLFKTLLLNQTLYFHSTKSYIVYKNDISVELTYMPTRIFILAYNNC